MTRSAPRITELVNVSHFLYRVPSNCLTYDTVWPSYRGIAEYITLFAPRATELLNVSLCSSYHGIAERMTHSARRIMELLNVSHFLPHVSLNC